jgi:hypothetical protein
VAHHERRELRTQVDERRSCREDRAQQQPDGDGDFEARVVGREKDALCADRVQPHEAAGGHERQRQEEDAGVAAPVRRLPCRITEAERHRPDEAEEDEMEPVVLQVRVELPAEQERNQPDQRQGGSDKAHGESRMHASLRPLRPDTLHG